jgi:hypothetical protein
VVPFPLEWSSDPDGMYCMLVLFQDATAWGSESCWTLSLQSPRANRPPFLDVNYIPGETIMSHQAWGTIGKCGKPDSTQQKPVLQQSHKPAHTQWTEPLVVLWRTFT